MQFDKLKDINKRYNFYGWGMVFILRFRANSKVDCCIVLSHCAFSFFTTQTLHAILRWYYFSFVFIETLIFCRTTGFYIFVSLFSRRLLNNVSIEAVLFLTPCNVVWYVISYILISKYISSFFSILSNVIIFHPLIEMNEISIITFLCPDF